jgi:hypothetical protein
MDLLMKCKEVNAMFAAFEGEPARYREQRTWMQTLLCHASAAVTVAVLLGLLLAFLLAS